MLGAIIGSIAGSRVITSVHQDNCFDLFGKCYTATGACIMTLAVARALLDCDGKWKQLGKQVTMCLQAMGRKYPDCGLSSEFNDWAHSDNPKPYRGSWNDAVVRVSPCGFIARTDDEVKLLVKRVTRVTHKCPEALKGAEAVAVAIFLARNGATKTEIIERFEKDYYPHCFSLDFLCNECQVDKTCERLAPLAFRAFIEADSFEDAIKNALRIPHDGAAIATIAGSIAEAYYGTTLVLKRDAMSYLSRELRGICRDWEKTYRKANPARKFNLLTKYIGKLENREFSEYVGPEFFSSEFFGFAKAHPEYKLDNSVDTLQKHGLEWKMASMQSADENKLCANCVLALIACGFRADHYATGVLDELINGGHIDKWLMRLKAIDDERSAIESDASALTQVKIVLCSIQKSLASELFITEQHLLISSDAGDGESVKCQYDFGLYSDLGEGILNAMKDCLEAEGWHDVQSPQEIDSCPNYYELEAKYENGKTVAHQGAFNRIHVPEKEFKQFIKNVRKAIKAFGQGGILSLDGFMIALRPGEVKYCGVDFSSGGKLYHYRTTDLLIDVGDRVIVPVSSDGGEREVTVKTVEFCSWDDTPYPLEQTKEIIRVAEHKIIEAEYIPFTGKKAPLALSSGQ